MCRFVYLSVKSVWNAAVAVCKVELRVPGLSSVIATHSSLITEVRQPPSLSLPYLLSIYHIPPFDQCQGHV